MGGVAGAPRHVREGAGGQGRQRLLQRARPARVAGLHGVALVREDGHIRRDIPGGEHGPHHDGCL